MHFCILLKQNTCMYVSIARCVSNTGVCYGDNSPTEALWADVRLLHKSSEVSIAICRCLWPYFLFIMLLPSGITSPIVFHLPSWEQNWTKGDIFMIFFLTTSFLGCKELSSYLNCLCSFQFKVFFMNINYISSSCGCKIPISACSHLDNYFTPSVLFVGL